MLKCGIFIMCSFLFLFVACFGLNFNAMTAATAAVLGYMIAAAALDTGFCHLFGSISIFNLLSSIISISFHYSTYLSSVFSISFHY